MNEGGLIWSYHRKEERDWWWNSHYSEGCGLKQCGQNRQLLFFQTGNQTLHGNQWSGTATSTVFHPPIHYTGDPSPQASWRTQSGCKSHEMFLRWLVWLTLQPRYWFCPCHGFDPCMVGPTQVCLPIRGAPPSLGRRSEKNGEWCCWCNSAYKKRWKRRRL